MDTYQPKVCVTKFDFFFFFLIENLTMCDLLHADGVCNCTPNIKIFHFESMDGARACGDGYSNCIKNPIKIF